MSIEVKHLTKAYGETCVWQDLTLSIPTGETTVLMGASGCGKTTLIRILLGLEQADAGEILGMLDKTAVVFQEDRLCAGFTAFENIALVVDAKKRNRQELFDYVSREAEQIGITGEQLRQRVTALSGGMKRRIALLRAVLYDADFIILDEACTGLDEETKKKTISYIKRKTAGKTLLVVTHNAEEATAFGGNICKPFD